MNTRRCLALVAAAMILPGGYVSGQLQWDTNVATAGAQGGTGDWIGTNFWYNGVSNVPWLDGSNASFGGTAGTVTVNAPLVANELNFLTNGYTIDGASTLTLGGAAPVVSVSTATDTATISATLGGSAGLTKTGSGTLALTGTNTFTGPVTINAGSISVTNFTDSGVAGPLGAGTSITLNGGRLVFNSAATDSTNRAITLGANGGTFHSGNASQSLTLSGVISGPGGLTKTGTGRLILTGTNTFTGPVAINAAFIEVSTLTDSGVPGPLGAGTNISMNGGAIIVPGFNSHSTNRAIATGPNGITFSPGNGTLTLSGPITGNGTFATTGNGVIVLTGTNTFTGDVFISSSTVRIAGGNAIPDTAEVFIGGFANPPKVLDVNNSNETIGSLRGGDATGGIVMLGSGTLTIGGDNSDKTYEGTINGTGGVVKIGTGTQTLTGTSTFTGPFTINGGAISVPDVADPTVVSPLGAGTALIFGGGTLIYTGTANDSTMRPITLNAGGGTFDVTNATATLALHGIIGGVGGLTKSGPGKAILSGFNTFTGPLVINGGAVSVITFSNSGVGSSIGAGNSISLNGGGLLYAGFGSVSTDRPVTVSGDASIGPGNGTLEYKGPITGTGNLSITGSGVPGVLILSGTNTYAGATTVVNTRLRLANGNAIPDTSAVSMGAGLGSLLDLDNTDETIGSLGGGGGPGGSVILGSGTLTTGGDNTDTTYASVISGTGGLTKTGTGTMTLTSGSTFFGPLNIRRGAISTHTVVGAGIGSPIGAGNLISLGEPGGLGTLIYTGVSDTDTNRAITLNGVGGGFEVADASTTLTLSGSITGSGGLTKSGPGRLIFPGTSTYTGPTTVSGGLLVLNNGLDTPGGTINIAAGATLQTRGFVSRAISGAGTITATGNLIIGNSSSPSGVVLDGTLDVGVHQVLLDDANTAQLGTTTTLGAGGRLNSFNGITVGSSRTVIVSAGASASISGNFVNNGSVAGGQLLTLNNNVSGVGSYTGNVQFAGNLSPGDNGLASILLENFIFTQTTTLSLEIGGLTAGSQHDQLVFTGTGVLDGVLNITLTNGFQPVQGNIFTILDGGTALTDGFDAINLPALSPNLFWTYSQTGNTAFLTVVPEPSAAVLMVISGALMLSILRRRGAKP